MHLRVILESDLFLGVILAMLSMVILNKVLSFLHDMQSI